MIPLVKSTFINEEITKKALADFILSSKHFSMGEQCFSFEKSFASMQGRNDAVLFNSGGSANLALLQALKNVGRLHDGDCIGFTALTWSTNVMPIIQLGMSPVGVDCEINTMNVSSRQLLQTLDKNNLKALFITNVLGFVDGLHLIKNICKDRGILLIEDNCESLGTVSINGKAGNFGLASTFSFYVSHHMSTIEGGMVCTDDQELAEMLKIVRANGWDRNLTKEQQKAIREKHKVGSEFEAKYTFYDLGYNLRPTEITGFLGNTQLLFLNDSIQKRSSNFLQIDEEMHKNDDFICIEHNHITQLSPFAIPIICKTWKLKLQYLAKFFDLGIETRPIIAGNIENQPFYKKYVSKKSYLPNTDFIHDNGFYCGNSPDYTDVDLRILKKAVSKI